MHAKQVWRGLLLLYVASGALADGAAGSTTFTSGERHVALIELYTSEGCSSCPPADRWLSALKEDPGLWTAFVPIALHVDYWDYIGWNDRFAHRDYSTRQRRYAQLGAAKVVYTPGVFKNGKEWRGWRNRRPEAATLPTPGALDVLVDGQGIAIRFASNSLPAMQLTAHVAVLGLNLQTYVEAGENSGRTLRHDFVVLGMRFVPLRAKEKTYRARLQMPATDVRASRQALAVWVSEVGQPAPIQAAGGYLEE